MALRRVTREDVERCAPGARGRWWRACRHGAPGCAGLQRAVDLGADAAIQLDEAGDLVTAFKELFGGDGPSYVFDALWGEPGATAVVASAPKATIVNLGQSAGGTAALSSEAEKLVVVP